MPFMEDGYIARRKDSHKTMDKYYLLGSMPTELVSMPRDSQYPKFVQIVAAQSACGFERSIGQLL
jgi:hypothetical protein